MNSETVLPALNLSNNRKKLKVVLAAGGTGGHIFPAQALAEILSQSGHEVHIMHDNRVKKIMHFDSSVIKYEISSKSVSGSFISKIKSLWHLFKVLFTVRKYFQEIKPDIVIGFGGYPSFPSIGAALLLRIKFILHEQNSVLGLVNKLFIRYARFIATGFHDVQGVRPKIP